MIRYGIIFFIILSQGCRENDDQPVAEIPADQPMKVEAVTVIPKPVAYEIYADGEVHAMNRQELAFPVTGEVKALRVYPGKSVKKGDTLVILEDRHSFFLLKQARARAEEARYAYESALLSYGRNGKVSETIRQSLRLSTGLEHADLEFARLEWEWGQHVLVARHDGLISLNDRWPVTRVAAGESLGRLYVPERLRICAYVLELHCGRITPGMRAAMTDMLGNSFEGTVESIDRWVDKDGFFKVWIRPSANRIWPGGHVTVRLHFKQHRGLTVPVRAVMERSDRLMVYTVRKGAAQWQYIRGGMQTQDYLEVLEGLDAGDTVLTGRLAELGHGMPVVPELVEKMAGR